MKAWLVEPTDKKSIYEHQYWTKDDNSILCIICWRSGSFLVRTEDDNPPIIEEGDDILACDYDSEMLGVYDNCSEDRNYDECDEETQEWLRTYLDEEGNNINNLEEHGWELVDTSMIINSPVQITEYKENT